MQSATLSILGFQNRLLRASNQFASVLRVNIASKSLLSNHRANRLRRNSMPLVYSVERLILQFGFEIALYRLESAVTSVGIVHLMH